MLQDQSITEDRQAIWNIYPAFIEFLLEYLNFIEFQISEEKTGKSELYAKIKECGVLQTIHFQGYFYSLDDNQSIEERLRMKQKTCIIPSSFLMLAQEELRHGIDQDLQVLNSNCLKFNINMINSKSEKDP